VAGDAHVGVLLAELHFPANRSLKDKRQPLSSLRDTLQRRYRASFAEVGDQDSWQLAEVLVVLAASSGRQARERIDEIDRYIHGRNFECSRVFVKSVDPVEDLWDSGS
jgi:uncharacterized protein YlxP (DUF503 family)